jgi:hypothetical protein
MPAPTLTFFLLCFFFVAQLRDKLAILERRVSHGQDERLSYWSCVMPASSGKHSAADKKISQSYGRKCLFCGCSGKISTVHLVAGNSKVNYSPFGSANGYIGELDVKSPRNFIPLCGTLGQEGTCHDGFDKHLIMILHNPLAKNPSEKYQLHCFGAGYQHLHGKFIPIPSDPDVRPYHRLLAWRARKCILEHGNFCDTDACTSILIANRLSEESMSVASTCTSYDDDDD